MTYKILFNDAVAMTGGQANDGGLTVPQIAAQVAAEGAKRIVVVTDEPWKYAKDTEWPRGLTVHHRDELDAVQRELATVPGLSVLIYDQTCAAEKRRRRKRGTFPDPDKRVVINDLVCEGCGDCGVKSNCVSVQPLETEWGRKRTIDQSSCNKDYSCVKGFCPSFVTVHGAKLKKGERTAEPSDWPALPAPSMPLINHPYSIIVTGIGGTGIVTIGGILGMAAHLEGKGVGVIDMAGLAQKGGAVYSHIRIANKPEDIHAIRVAAGGADLVLGGDIVVAGNKKVLGAVKPGDQDRRQQRRIPARRFHPQCRFLAADRAPQARDRDRPPATTFAHFVDATRIATALLGQSIGANMFMVGYAYQIGALPLSAEAIEKAIELNGEAVAMNIAAFRWGRRAALDPAAVETLMKPRAGSGQRRAQAVAIFRRDGRPSRGVSDGLSECSLCAALPQLGRESTHRGSRKGARPMRARRGGGALSVQADGLQGRIRSRAALRRHIFSRAREIELRRRQAALRIPSRAAVAGAARSGDRRAEER